jgi:LysM repeat protein
MKEAILRMSIHRSAMGKAVKGQLFWFVLCVVLLFGATTQSAAAQTNDVHTVAPGETLTSIARRYDTDVATLMRLNGIQNPELIRVGQRLAVPSNVAGSGAGRSSLQGSNLQPSAAFDLLATRIYFALPGDTLSSLAARFHTTPAHLAELNLRSLSTPLLPGEALRVPVHDGAAPTFTTRNTMPLSGRAYVHVVREGETLASIASAYGTSLRRILELNKIADARQVKAGQRLIVPPPSLAELFAAAPMGANGVPLYPVVPTEGKWISVDLDHQRAYAWEGNKLVKRFVISSGKAKTPTVTGVFRIWAKVSSQVMQGGSRAAGDYYYLPNVQWVQYFYRDYAFHGAYWHNNFGTPMSRGCINMTNSDAKWLWDWTTPTVGPGWHVLDESNPGTLVIVHR